MSAGDPVRDAGDGRLRQERLQEFEFARAGVLVPFGNGQNGAIVLPDQITPVGTDYEISELAILIENGGEFRDLAGERETGDANARPIEPPVTASIEDAHQQIGVFFVQVVEEFVREAFVGAGKETIARVGERVDLARTSATVAIVATGDEPVLLERRQMLARTAGSYAGVGAECFGIRLAVPFQELEDFPARGRQSIEGGSFDRGGGHRFQTFPRRPVRIGEE